MQCVKKKKKIILDLNLSEKFIWATYGKERNLWHMKYEAIDGLLGKPEKTKEKIPLLCTHDEEINLISKKFFLIFFLCVYVLTFASLLHLPTDNYDEMMENRILPFTQTQYFNAIVKGECERDFFFVVCFCWNLRSSCILVHVHENEMRW